MDAAAAAAALPRGRCVSVELTGAARARGWVHSVDKSAGIAVLEEIGEPGGRRLVLFALAAVRTVTPLQSGARTWPDKLESARVDVVPVLRKRHAEYAQIGVGVSGDAQRVFNALAKTLPCRWERDVIVVLDTVRIAPPYTVAAMSKDGEDGVKARVRMVLERSANGALK